MTVASIRPLQKRNGGSLFNRQSKTCPESYRRIAGSVTCLKMTSNARWMRERKMKTHLNCAVFTLCLSLAVCCEAADSTPITINCDTLQSSPVTNLEQRIEIAAPGFSILPPRGELGCYRLMSSQGVSFFKIPQSRKAFDGPPSLETAVLRLSGAMAMSLKGLRDF